MQVRVVIPPWDDPESAGRRDHDGSLEIIHTGAPATLLAPLSRFREAMRLVDEFAPDIVHTFKPIGYSGALAWWKSRSSAARKPLVVLDTDDLEGPRGWSRRRALTFSGWLRGWQEIQSLRTVGHVTVASRWLESFAETLGVPRAHVHWLPQGWTRTAPGDLPRGDVRSVGAPTLLWYTRFTEADPRRAVRLFAPLLQAPDRRLVVLGNEVRPGARAEVEAAFSVAGLGNRISWQAYGFGGLNGVLEAQPIALALYPLDNDLANRARCPTKLMELMAAGVPVVAEDVGEARSYLGRYEDECLAPPDEPAAFVGRAERLLLDPLRGGDLGKRLSSEADHFEWSALIPGLLNWYATLSRAG
jgi:glycosyltransferase involved in cell wall biosynthesis